MKLLIGIILSIVGYFGLYYAGLSSWMIWIALIVIWSFYDYFTYDNSYSWTDYVILVVIVSAIEYLNQYGYLAEYV